MAGIALPEAARAMLNSGELAHVTTLNIDGSPHVVCVWVEAEGDEVVFTAMSHRRRYMHNLTHDPRIAISIHNDEVDPNGLQQYLVVEGRARIIEGGGREKLAQLAKRYLGADAADFVLPDVPGYVIRVTPTNLLPRWWVELEE